MRHGRRERGFRDAAVTAYVALLRAVNVGGTGKLAMTDLAGLCADAGFSEVRTYIASGNVVFHGEGGEAEVRSALADRLHAYAGRPVGVVVWSGVEMAETVARSPFPDAPGAQVAALFVDGDLPADPLEGAAGRGEEQVRLGPRALYVLYPGGMGRSRLRLPAAARGTARNMNTVAVLADWARALG